MLQWKTCLRAGVTVALVYLAIHYWGPVSAALGVLIGAAWPLLLGAGIAYVVNILMRFYETHVFRKCRRPLFLQIAAGRVHGGGVSDDPASSSAPSSA